MKNPAFQFYPTDYIGSQRVQMLSLEEEGAYIRCLCFCWQHGSIPSDPCLIARLVGKGCSTTVASAVADLFQSSLEPGRLTHDRLDAEKEKQTAWKEKCSKGGHKSVEMRNKLKGSSTTVERVVEQAPLKGTTNIPSPSPSPSPSPKREREDSTRPIFAEIPCWAEFWGYCQTQACLLPAEWYARDKFEAANADQWKNKSDWRAYARRCKGWWQADGRPMTPKTQNGPRNGKQQSKPVGGNF